MTRPRIGPKLEVRFPPDLLALIDESRGDTPRPEMIRRLVTEAFEARDRQRPTDDERPQGCGRRVTAALPSDR